MDMTELASVANQIRIDIVTMLEKAGSGHPGGSLSSADIMCALYFGGVMNHDAAHPLMPERDRFVLAKGHAAPVLYATLARAGYIDPAELATLRKLGSRLQGHPDCNLVPVFNEMKIRISFADTSKRFFHRRSSSAIRILSDCVWHR